LIYTVTNTNKDAASMTDASQPAIDPAWLEQIRCPVTLSRLRLAADSLIGEVGGLRYPIRDGIPVLLAEEATLPAGFDSLDAFKRQFAKPGR
jgi:uncharacterized protein